MRAGWIDWVRNNCYFSSLMMLVMVIPLSKALLSISLGLFVFSWLFAPGLKARVRVLKNRKSIWFLLLGYLVVAAGLLYSEDTGRNLFLLGKIKISQVILPVVMGTFDPLSKRKLKLLLIAFTLANFIASLVSSLILFQVINYEITDVRKISVFISSISFALLIALNILFLAYALKNDFNPAWRMIYLVLIIWFIILLCFMQALTGLITIMFALLVEFMVYFVHIKKVWRVVIPFFLILIIILGSFYIIKINSEYHVIHNFEYAKLPKLTKNGNPYLDNKQDTTRINGYLIWINVCEPELRKQWSLRSLKPFDSLDLRGWVPIKTTLVSYLSSMGLTKDSAGMAQLKDKDIRYIERGYNNKLLTGIGLKARMFDLVREFDTWNRTKEPAGSVTIRLNALINGWKVFKKAPLIGTGYGDINDDIQMQYNSDNQVYGFKMRQNPHNQFFTVLIGAGIIGFVAFLISFVLPGIFKKNINLICFLDHSAL